MLWLLEFDDESRLHRFALTNHAYEQIPALLEARLLGKNFNKLCAMDPMEWIGPDVLEEPSSRCRLHRELQALCCGLALLAGEHAGSAGTEVELVSLEQAEDGTRLLFQLGFPTRFVAGQQTPGCGNCG